MGVGPASGLHQPQSRMDGSGPPGELSAAREMTRETTVRTTSARKNRNAGGRAGGESRCGSAGGKRGGDAKQKEHVKYTEAEVLFF
jgi:hypothetical protein